MTLENQTALTLDRLGSSVAPDLDAKKSQKTGSPPFPLQPPQAMQRPRPVSSSRRATGQYASSDLGLSHLFWRIQDQAVSHRTTYIPWTTFLVTFSTISGETCASMDSEEFVKGVNFDTLPVEHLPFLSYHAGLYIL